MVIGESEVTWTRFIQHLKEALEADMENITIISDSKKGLQGAIGMLFPHVEHRVCRDICGRN